MIDAANQLKRSAAILRESGDPAVLAVAAGLEAYLAGEASLPDALGVGPKRQGEWTLPTRLQLEERDAHLRCAAQMLNVPPHRRVAALDAALRLFGSTTWRLTRTESECPARLLGKIEERFWLALRAFDRAPGPGQLRNILRESGNPI